MLRKCWDLIEISIRRAENLEIRYRNSINSKVKKHRGRTEFTFIGLFQHTLDLSAVKNRSSAVAKFHIEHMMYLLKFRKKSDCKSAANFYIEKQKYLGRGFVYQFNFFFIIPCFFFFF